MNLRSYIVGVRLFASMLLAAGSLFAQVQRASLDEGFDKPIKITVLDLGPSPYYVPTQHVRIKLTCYYYGTFTVKEYDEGQKGAEVSILTSPHAPCTRTDSKNENLLAHNEWAGGYFIGANGQYVFVDAPDGTDGGLPFAVFDVSTRRKVFADSSRPIPSPKALHTKETFRISREADQTLRLVYVRVVHPECDLNTDAAGCWKKARVMFGIAQTDMPVCNGYETVREKLDSVIAYPVSVLLTDSPHIEATVGPIFCSPIE